MKKTPLPPRAVVAPPVNCPLCRVVHHEAPCFKVHGRMVFSCPQLAVGEMIIVVPDYRAKAQAVITTIDAMVLQTASITPSVDALQTPSSKPKRTRGGAR